ncbi:MAG: hypothetical protein CSB34_03000 [Desulfobulbus propionicus]|nr:MAG: hypothetical protein CSB34_03000 [Desulfobulbus propionicus]
MDSPEYHEVGKVEKALAYQAVFRVMMVFCGLGNSFFVQGGAVSCKKAVFMRDEKGGACGF